MRNRITQQECAFYILYQEFKKNHEMYHSPSIVDVGDVYIKEVGKWVFTTWKTPTRLTDIFQKNPGLLERISVRAKAGNRYYKYRISNTVKVEDIKDPELLAFYNKIKRPSVKLDTNESIQAA